MSHRNITGLLTGIGNAANFISGILFLALLTGAPLALADRDNGAPSVSVLTNLQLTHRAETIKNTNVSSTHRMLNYQWLSSHQRGKAKLNGKAWSELGKRIYDEYLDDKREAYFGDKAYIPDGNGNARFSDIDYKVRVSSSKVKVGLTYRF